MVVRCSCGHAFWKQSVEGPGGRVVEYGDLDRKSSTFQATTQSCPTCGEVLREDDLRVDQATSNAILSCHAFGGPFCPGVPAVYHQNLWRPSNVPDVVPDTGERDTEARFRAERDAAPRLPTLHPRVSPVEAPRRPPGGPLRQVLSRVAHVASGLWSRIRHCNPWRDERREA